MLMKTVLALVCLLLVSNAFASDCVTNARGRVICTNGEKAVAVNPNTGTINTATRNQAGATAVKSASGNSAAAYNPRTGNAAVAQKNQNGVTTTQTSRGGESKTKNGKGVYEAPNGTKCAKTAYNKGCT
jgi:hypothetical protein